MCGGRTPGPAIKHAQREIWPEPATLCSARWSFVCICALFCAYLMVSGLVGSDGVWASVINGRDEDTQGPVVHSCCLVLSTDVRTVLDSLEVFRADGTCLKAGNLHMSVWHQLSKCSPEMVEVKYFEPTFLLRP